MNIISALNGYLNHTQYFLKHSNYSLRRTKFEVTFFAKKMQIESLSEANEATLRAYFLKGMQELLWQPSTYLAKHMTLKVFFKWCIEQKWITTNPVKDIPRPRLDKKLPKRLTKEEALRILDIAYNLPYRYQFVRTRNHAMFATCLFTGVRRSELISLKCTDVDVENLTVFVRAGKGRKDRIIPMSYRLAEILKGYLKERNKLSTIIPELFITCAGKRSMSLNSLLAELKRFKKITKIKFHLHQLRHTFATLMLEGGCDIYSLSKMMGHSDISTTTIYLSASVEHLRGQIIKHPLNSY